MVIENEKNNCKMVLGWKYCCIPTHTNREVVCCIWLGRGSIVIIISRDKQILKAHGVDVIYQVKPLNDEDAARLFCRKAFKSNYIVSDFEKMTGDALVLISLLLIIFVEISESCRVFI